MSILTDDCDIRDTKFWMEHGGNGDYYISLLGTQKIVILDAEDPNKRSFTTQPIRLDVRFAMSGGNTNRHPEVRSAIVALYRALEAAGLNNHPNNEKK